MDFSHKYKKYKNKYLELKNLFQKGGATKFRIGDTVKCTRNGFVNC